MSDKINERLESEAREALVAADLSAKMKQWRNPPPPDERPQGGSRFRLLLLLLALCGAAWWFWPAAKNNSTPIPVSPVEYPAPTLPPPVAPAPQQQQEPIAQRPAANKYLAMAESNYHSPDFGSEIRGNAGPGEGPLNDARRALAESQPAEAFAALKNVSTEYRTDADYLRAHALFAQKKYAPSAALFGQLTGSVRYGEAAQWYQILALLPDIGRNKSMIMNRLNKIADDDSHTFQKEATRLKVLLK